MESENLKHTESGNVKRIEPVGTVNARVRLPGSKSVTHRAFLMAALADGDSTIGNPLRAEDTLLTARALEQLGVRIRWDDAGVSVTPPPRRWSRPGGPLLLGNSGTSTRLLLAVAAAGEGRFVFDGSARLRERPMSPVLEALERLGAGVRWLARPGCLPVEIQGCGLSGGEVEVDASESSQFLSALLMAAPCARGEMRIGWKQPVASFPYVRLTLSMMKDAGITLFTSGENGIVIPAPQTYSPLRMTVEGDFSSASYFWAAAAVTGGAVHTSPLSRKSAQGDRRLLDILECMGCGVSWEEEGVRVTGAGAGNLNAVNVDMNDIPDMVPTLAVLAAFARGTTRIRNVAHLRVKESDRLRTVALELAKLDVPVSELPDGLEILGGEARPPRVPIESHNDHRIAMAFAVAGLRTGGMAIRGAAAVAKSFPAFWDILDGLGR